jgi:hypothetical protein
MPNHTTPTIARKFLNNPRISFSAAVAHGTMECAAAKTGERFAATGLIAHRAGAISDILAIT